VEVNLVGGTIKFSIGVMLVIFSLPVHGSETEIAPVGMLSGGIHGQSSSLIVDGMFGSTCDGTASGIINTLHSGEAGQLYEPVGILAYSPPTGVPETSSCQLSAISTNDDGTYTDVAVNWTVLDGPLVSVDSNGTALAGTVYRDSQAVVAASSLGLTGTVNLKVLDTLKDNYGLYAADGIADPWQVDYFGVDNTNGLASVDADHDGADNFSEFMAGTLPLNGSDVFGVRSLRRQSPEQMELVLAPAFSNRIYSIEGCTNLHDANWVRLVSSGGPTQITQLVVADIPSLYKVMFYRASIEYAW
jgi:hypothetical protein